MSIAENAKASKDQVIWSFLIGLLKYIYMNRGKKKKLEKLVWLIIAIVVITSMILWTIAPGF
ncbi:MAG: hypothetical protein COU51_04505 [Parcubacteria group bacterium CG10_big_fil_rev_8_21_14_0_10_36_14]|nr:MAG: hypothetical protein COU51_04505 [Parcubacteria group bacterium CG10_big_fil_rev_8_21_14_0_10_36_14]